VWIFNSIVVSGVFKAFLAILAPGVGTERTLNSSSALFFESFDSPST